MKHTLSDINEVNKTKERIMLEASSMFARRGYASVSMRDIAKQVGIKAASIYKHYESKEALFYAIVDNISNEYLKFYNRIEKEIEKTTNFEEVLDCLFEELLEVYQIFIYYGLSLITTEQFRDEKARAAFVNVFMKTGIEYSKSKFDECVKKKWVKEFDTEALSFLFTNSVLSGTLMRTHENMGHELPYDPKKMLMSLRCYMLDSVEIIE